MSDAPLTFEKVRATLEQIKRDAAPWAELVDRASLMPSDAVPAGTLYTLDLGAGRIGIVIHRFELEAMRRKPDYPGDREIAAFLAYQARQLVGRRNLRTRIAGGLNLDAT